MTFSKIKAFWLLLLWPANFWGTNDFLQSAKELRNILYIYIYRNSPCESKIVHAPCEQTGCSSQSHTGCILFEKCSNSQYLKITENHRLFIRRTLVVFGPSIDQISWNLWHPWDLVVQSVSEHSLWRTLETTQSAFFLLIGKIPFLILNRNLSPCNKFVSSVPHPPDFFVFRLNILRPPQLFLIWCSHLTFPRAKAHVPVRSDPHRVQQPHSG